MNKKNLAIIILSALMVLSPAIGYAAPTYTALEPLPCIPGGVVTCPSGNGNLQSTFDFQTYVQYIFNLAIALAAAASVFMIVLGGLQYMTTDSWTDKKAGLEKAKHSVYGLILILCSYLILRTVDPRLVAIPTTLVAPLNIDYSNSALNDILGSVSTLGSQYQTQYNNAVTSSVALQTKIAADNTKIDTLKAAAIAAARQAQKDAGYADSALATDISDACSGLQPSWESPASSDACTAYGDALQDKKTDQSNVFINAAKGRIDQSLAKCLSQIDLTVLKNRNDCHDLINQAATDNVPPLVGLGVDPKPVNEYASYANGTIEIAAYATSWAGRKLVDADYGQFIKNTLKYSDPITTPDTKALLIKQRDKYIVQLGGVQAKIDDGTYLKAYTTSSVAAPSF